MYTSAQFKHNTTTHGFFGCKNSRGRLTQIDIALDAWEALQNHASKDQKVALLWQMIKECRKWLKSKAGKTTKNCQKRRGEVSCLAADAYFKLTQIAPELDKALSTFAQHKARGPRADVKTLSGVYRHERGLYVKSGKTYAPSGTLLDVQFGRLTKQQEARFGGREFGQLTEKDYALLDKIAGKSKPVLYMSKIQRMKYMVIPNGEYFYDIEDNIFTMPAAAVGFVGGKIDYDKGGGWTYAIDQYSNLFTRDDRAAVDSSGNPIQFNHSSFNAGRDVMCAGVIKIWQGELISISNNSGHYKPSRRLLYGVVNMFKDEGVKLDNTEVQVWEPPPGGGGMNISMYDAVPFASNRVDNPPQLREPVVFIQD